jgi:hypothetical protein
VVKRRSVEVGKRRRSGGTATMNLGARAGKSAKKIYGGVLTEVGPAIAIVLAATLACCSKSRFWERRSAEMGKRRRNSNTATTNLGARAGKSVKKIYGGVLKEVGPAIATILAAMPARCSKSRRSPPPRAHSPGTPPLPFLSSGYIIGNLRA